MTDKPSMFKVVPYREADGTAGAARYFAYWRRPAAQWHVIAYDAAGNQVGDAKAYRNLIMILTDWRIIK